MKELYIIKGEWDNQIVFYTGIDTEHTFYGLPVVKLSTSIDEAKMFSSIEDVEEAYNEVSHANFKIYPVCPICGEYYSEPPAISRKDNKTKICPNCGVGEAFMDFVNHYKKSA